MNRGGAARNELQRTDFEVTSCESQALWLLRKVFGSWKRREHVYIWKHVRSGIFWKEAYWGYCGKRVLE
jgi:hypothetical protein